MRFGASMDGDDYRAHRDDGDGWLPGLVGAINKMASLIAVQFFRETHA